MESIKYSGCAENYADIQQMKASMFNSTKIRLSVIDSQCKIGIIAVQFSGESLEIKHECWIDTGLDFINCLFLADKLYFTEYGDLYSLNLENVGKAIEKNKLEKERLMVFENKIVSILEVGPSKKYVFLENGIFYELDENSSENKSIEDAPPLHQNSTGFDHVYSVSSSLNGVLIVVSGKLKSFSPRIITKVMIHPTYFMSCSAPGKTFSYICNCLKLFKQKLGDYSDIIYAMRYQNLLIYIKKYLEKLLFKEKSKNSNIQREEILIQLCEELKMHRIDLKMLVFGFYSNICYHERQLKLMDINHNVEGLVENMSQSESSKNYSESVK